jgi:hypothetical protein
VERVVGSCHSHSKDIAHLKDVLDVCVDAPISVARSLSFGVSSQVRIKFLGVVGGGYRCVLCLLCVCVRGWWALASWRKLYPGSQKGESKGLVRHMKSM